MRAPVILLYRLQASGLRTRGGSHEGTQFSEIAEEQAGVSGGPAAREGFRNQPSESALEGPARLSK
jgi:hypothetical protein